MERRPLNSLKTVQLPHGRRVVVDPSTGIMQLEPKTISALVNDASQQGRTVEDLIVEVKRHIALGKNARLPSLRSAAQIIAALCKQRLAQRTIARRIGMSVGWVNAILKWHKNGYNGFPFADRPVQGLNEPRGKAGSKETTTPTPSCQSTLLLNRAEFSASERVAFIDLLHSLSCPKPLLRARFAATVEVRRSELGLSWDDLIIPPTAEGGLSK